VLGLVGLFEPVGNAMGWLMISQGRSRDVLHWGLINSTITVASFLIGLRWGAFGVAVSFSLIGTFIRFPLLFWFATRVGPVRMADIYTAMVVPLLAAGGVLGAIYGFRHVVVLSPFAGVVSSSVIALLATAIVFVVTPKGRTGISDLKLIIQQLITKQTQDQTC